MTLIAIRRHSESDYTSGGITGGVEDGGKYGAGGGAYPPPPGGTYEGLGIAGAGLPGPPPRSARSIGHSENANMNAITRFTPGMSISSDRAPGYPAFAAMRQCSTADTTIANSAIKPKTTKVPAAAAIAADGSTVE